MVKDRKLWYNKVVDLTVSFSGRFLGGHVSPHVDTKYVAYFAPRKVIHWHQVGITAMWAILPVVELMAQAVAH